MSDARKLSAAHGDSLFAAATRRGRSVTSGWDLLQELIGGVRVREVRNVPKRGGHVTELYRRDWALDELAVDQVFQVTLQPGAVSAWHAHRLTTDRIFVNAGMITVALYDGREDSATYGRVNEFRAGELRPMLVVIPPGVWHGVHNAGATMASLINVVDIAYAYDDPDHWALPWDTDRIRYRFDREPGTNGAES